MTTTSQPLNHQIAARPACPPFCHTELDCPDVNNTWTLLHTADPRPVALTWEPGRALGVAAERCDSSDGAVNVSVELTVLPWPLVVAGTRDIADEILPLTPAEAREIGVRLIAAAALAEQEAA